MDVAKCSSGMTDSREKQSSFMRAFEKFSACFYYDNVAMKEKEHIVCRCKRYTVRK